MKLTKSVLKQIIAEELAEIGRRIRGGDDEAYGDRRLAAAERERARLQQSNEIDFMNAKIELQNVVDQVALPLLRGETPAPDRNKMYSAILTAIQKKPILTAKSARLDIEDIINNRIAQFEYGGSGFSPDKPFRDSILGQFGPGKPFQDENKINLWNSTKTQIVDVVKKIVADTAALEPDDAAKLDSPSINEGKKLRVKISK